MSRQPRRVIAVLGMHRSGTSCLTGSLQEAGLELGDYHAWNPYNLKGNRENQGIVDLHDRILADNQGAWDRPPGQVVWSPSHIEQARALLASYADYPVLGFKDPRTLLVLDGWKALVPGLELVGIFRHPDAVARSLARRSGMDRHTAMALWLAYNQRLYREFRRQAFPLLCFDLPGEAFNQRVDAVIRQLGLRAVSGSQRFYDSELKNFRDQPEQRLPWRLRWLYHRLSRASSRAC